MRTLWLGLLLAGAAHAEAIRSRVDTACVLRAVAGHMGVTLRPEIAVPRLRYQSDTPLGEFQDAVEAQWGFRPQGFTNVFVIGANDIYLIDDAEYYRRHDRFLEDSLAHELTHFVQVRYRGLNLNEEEFAELEAVDVQTWFRETYAAKGRFPEDCGPS